MTPTNSMDGILMGPGQHERKRGATQVSVTSSLRESPGMDIPADSALRVVEKVEAELLAARKSAKQVTLSPQPKSD